MSSHLENCEIINEVILSSDVWDKILPSNREIDISIQLIVFVTVEI